MPTILPLQNYTENSDMIKPFESKTSQRELKENYDFFEILGEGSFAKVYRCVEKETEKSYAVKELDCHGDGAYKAKIEQEVEILKDLRHENIVSLHQSFEDGDAFYLVMELVDDGSLFDEIIHQTVYSEKQALRITKQLLEALEYLHNQRIVHRDIKPDNLLIQRQQANNSDVIIKITDFGLAQRLPSDSDVISCEAGGAAMFLAPETILEEPIGCAVDVWSTGVILYLMLAGYPPFWSSSDEQLLLSILRGDYTMPSPYWDNIKPTTKDLVRGLIVTQPENRLTATQALDHPAVSDGALGRKISLEPERKRDFLAVISGIRAMIKFKRANVKSASRRLSERGELKSPLPIHHHHHDTYQTELESVFE